LLWVLAWCSPRCIEAGVFGWRLLRFRGLAPVAQQLDRTATAAMFRATPCSL